MQFDERQLKASPILAHADFGAPDCCGCLMAIIRGEHANIECSECGTVVRTVMISRRNLATGKQSEAAK